MDLWMFTLPSSWNRRPWPKTMLPTCQQCLLILVALQDIAIQFFKFVEEKFPAMDGMSSAKIVLSKQSKVQKKILIRCLLLQSTRTYCKEIDLAHEGAVLLRPWMLPWRMDYGLRGTSDVVPRCEMLEFFSVLGSFIVFCLETDFNLYHLLNHCCPGRMFNGAWCSSCAIKASRVTRATLQLGESHRRDGYYGPREFYVFDWSNGNGGKGRSNQRTSWWLIFRLCGDGWGRPRWPVVSDRLWLLEVHEAGIPAERGRRHLWRSTPPRCAMPSQQPLWTEPGNYITAEHEAKTIRSLYSGWHHSVPVVYRWDLTGMGSGPNHFSSPFCCGVNSGTTVASGKEKGLLFHKPWNKDPYSTTSISWKVSGRVFWFRGLTSISLRSASLGLGNAVRKVWIFGGWRDRSNFGPGPDYTPWN